MGLCPSRNAKSSPQKTDAPLATRALPAAGGLQLRADAPAFVPDSRAPAPAEPVQPPARWESFLEEKNEEKQMRKGGIPFIKRKDGTFTSGYQQLLQQSAGTGPPAGQRPVAHDAATDLLQDWREAAQAYKPDKPGPLPAKKAKKVSALKRAMLMERQPGPATQLGKVWHTPETEDHQQLLEELTAQERAQRAKDDLAVPTDAMPFGLADAYYVSGAEDKAGGHRHLARGRGAVRKYVDAPPTRELDERVAALLFGLRQLKGSDGKAAPKRYMLGLREVSRALRTKELRLLLIAPDLESECLTAGLDAKIAELITQAKAQSIPVIYALSRWRIGQAIQKNVRVSVLGVHSVRGAAAAHAALLAELDGL